MYSRISNGWLGGTGGRGLLGVGLVGWLVGG